MSDIVERLREQHSDLKQGALFSRSEDPTWDVTTEAADEIERLRKQNSLLAAREIELHLGIKNIKGSFHTDWNGEERYECDRQGVFGLSRPVPENGL